MSLVIKQTRVVEVPVQSISVAATCQQAMLIDAAGQCVGSTSAMPSFMPTLLEIDLATGQIKNWTVPTGEQLQAIADACADGQKSKIERKAHEEQLKNDVKKRHEYVLAQLRISEPLVVSPALTTTCAPPQAVESAAVTVASTADCAPPDQQSNPLEIEGIKADDEPTDAPELVEVDSGILMFGGVVPEVVPVAKKPSVDIGVGFSKAIGKWVADIENHVVGEHQATSTQGKFEAIKNVLKKAGLNGVYEINQRDSIDDVEFYSYDDSRTKDRMSIYVSGHKVSKDCVASTSKGHRYTAPSRAQALDGLIANVLKVVLPDDAIVDTTDDAMLFAEKLRYSIDTAKAVAIVEPEPTTTDIEDAPQPICQPARPRYRNPDDHSQTWTGRGKPPEWLQAKLDNGAQLGDYRIKAN